MGRGVINPGFLPRTRQVSGWLGSGGEGGGSGRHGGAGVGVCAPLSCSHAPGRRLPIPRFNDSSAEPPSPFSGLTKPAATARQDPEARLKRLLPKVSTGFGKSKKRFQVLKQLPSLRLSGHVLTHSVFSKVSAVMPRKSVSPVLQPFFCSHQLCGLGPVTLPLWASVYSYRVQITTSTVSEEERWLMRSTQRCLGSPERSQSLEGPLVLSVSAATPYSQRNRHRSWRR